jgi:hypothetical protein
VESWFATLITKGLRRGVHRSTWTLEVTIARHPRPHNEQPKPFAWTKTADDIVVSIARLCMRIYDSGQAAGDHCPRQGRLMTFFIEGARC